MFIAGHSITGNGKTGNFCLFLKPAWYDIMGRLLRYYRVRHYKQYISAEVNFSWNRKSPRLLKKIESSKEFNNISHCFRGRLRGYSFFDRELRSRVLKEVLLLFLFLSRFTKREQKVFQMEQKWSVWCSRTKNLRKEQELLQKTCHWDERSNYDNLSVKCLKSVVIRGCLRARYFISTLKKHFCDAQWV